MGTQENHLIETVLLGTHNICFGGDIQKNQCSFILRPVEIHYFHNQMYLVNYDNKAGQDIFNILFLMGHDMTKSVLKAKI